MSTHASVGCDSRNHTRTRAEPDDAGSAFDLLPDRGVIASDTAAALRAAVGLRNRIAHGYAMLDYERIHGEAQDGIPALRCFLIAIADAADA